MKLIKFNTIICTIIFGYFNYLAQSNDSIKASFYFDNDIDVLSETEQYSLSTFISNIKYQDIASVRLEAHADSNHNIKYNDFLSKRRLNYVNKKIRPYLGKIKPGLDFFGERKQVDLSQPFSANRRVDITIYFKELKNIKTFYSDYKKKPEIFTIQPTNDTLLITKSGVSLRIKKNSFKSDNSNPIEIRITRYNSKSDIVLNNLNTVTTENEILESATMINIEAFQGGEKLSDVLNKEIRAKIKVDTIKPGMKLITGNFNEDSVHKWTWGQEDDTISKPINRSFFWKCIHCMRGCAGGPTFTHSRDSIYTTKYINESKFNYFTCTDDVFVNQSIENKRMTIWKRIFWRKKRKLKERENHLPYIEYLKNIQYRYVVDSIHNGSISAQKTYFNSSYKNNIPESFKINQEDSIYQITTFDLSTYNDSLQSCYDNCPPKNLFRYLNPSPDFINRFIKDTALYTSYSDFDRLARAKVLLNITNEEILLMDTSQLQKTILNLEALETKLIKDVINKTKSIEDADKLYSDFNELFHLKTKELFLNGDITMTEYTSASEENTVEDLINYEFSLTELGLLNIDAFADFGGEKRYDLKVKFKTRCNDYKLVFKGFRGVVPGEIVDGKKNTVVFRNVPEDQGVYIVGINYLNDKEFPVQFSKKYFKTSANKDLVHLKFGNQITFKQLQKELEFLDKLVPALED